MDLIMTENKVQISIVQRNGIALVAVLAILVVLAIMSAAFAVLMSIERQSAATTVAKVQSDLCAEAGLQHALSLLRMDYLCSLPRG